MKKPSFGLHHSLAFQCLLAFSLAQLAHTPPVEAAGDTRADVLIVVGPSNHPPGSHEVAAGARLVQYCLEHAANVDGIRARVSYEWPADSAILEGAASIVFIGDQFPPARLTDSKRVMKELTAMMNRGCGIVCLHYATGLTADDVAENGDHPLLHWTGGYFATRGRHHQSVARVLTATITPSEARHPVLRGWRAFTLEEEPYYNNYFGPNGPAKNVTAVATSMLPPDAPKKEIVAWAVERPDGGRGMGIVMPHFYRSWKVEDLRKCILNGIVWTAKLEVPSEGVRTELPDLGTFQPAAVEPKPLPAKR